MDTTNKMGLVRFELTTSTVSRWHSSAELQTRFGLTYPTPKFHPKVLRRESFTRFLLYPLSTRALSTKGIVAPAGPNGMAGVGKGSPHPHAKSQIQYLPERSLREDC